MHQPEQASATGAATRHADVTRMSEVAAAYLLNDKGLAERFGCRHVCRDPSVDKRGRRLCNYRNVNAFQVKIRIHVAIGWPLCTHAGCCGCAHGCGHVWPWSRPAVAPHLRPVVYPHVDLAEVDVRRQEVVAECLAGLLRPSRSVLRLRTRSHMRRAHMCGMTRSCANMVCTQDTAAVVHHAHLGAFIVDLVTVLSVNCCSQGRCRRQEADPTGNPTSLRSDPDPCPNPPRYGS